MSIKKNLLTFIALSAILLSCDSNNEPVIVSQSIHKATSTNLNDSIPYATIAELKSVVEGNVVDYSFARKIAILELSETGLMQNMGWEGCKLSEEPVIIYDLNCKPRFYDFIVKDAEANNVGYVRAYAKKENSTIVEGTYHELVDYNKYLKKSSSQNATFFIDWKGSFYIGEKTRAGGRPAKLKEGESGQNSDAKELEGMQIIDYMIDNILPSLIVTDDKQKEILSKIPADLLKKMPKVEENDTQSFESTTIEAMRDSLVNSLETKEKNATAYWNLMTQNDKEISNAKDDDLANSSKLFGRLIRRIISGVDTKPHMIYKYHNYDGFRRNIINWCGPWACSYILYVNQRVDKYSFFESCASSFGELAILNFTLRLLGRPMTPVEMAWSMPIASNGRIWIDPSLIAADSFAYDQIVHYDKPALRLCATQGGLHWTIAYGAYQTGNWAWRNYYFRQIDNNALVGKPKGNLEDKQYYQQVDFWNPWLMVWD